MGMLLHSENKLDEISKILEYLMKLVPWKKMYRFQLVRAVKVDDTSFSCWVGINQLTAARIRMGTQALCATQDKAMGRYVRWRG